MKLFIPILFILSLAFLPSQSYSQISKSSVVVDSTRTVVVVLVDDNRLRGEILSVTDEHIELQVAGSSMRIRLDRIDIILELDDITGRSWFKNPNQSRLLISPTAKPLERGTGYYQNIYVLFSNVAYAFTDNFSVTGGLSMIPGVAIDRQLYFLSAKYSGSVSGNHYMGVGGAVASAGAFNDGLMIGFANYTYDFGRGGLTAGVNAFGVSDETGTVSVMAGGDYRISRRIAFVSENHYFPEVREGVYSYGLRFMGEQISVDLAFLQPGFDANLGFGIPYLDFVFNF